MAAQFPDISPKYKDFVSKNTLVHPGPPGVYKVEVKQEKIGNLTKIIVGEKTLEKTNKTILLVGETGAGKSTLVNVLFNYTMGVKFEDGVWFEVVEEEERSPTESQTPDVIVYEMCEGQSVPYSLNVIDTPGYGSTGGIERDVLISQRLLDLFQSEDGVHELHAVGLVIKASENRLSDRLRYIFDNVLSLFGKNLEKNIVVLITNSGGRRPKYALKALEAAQIKCARNEKNEPIHFLFNNCQSDDRTDEDENKILKSSFDKANIEMSQLEKFLTGVEAQKLSTTLEVLNVRISLAACIYNLQERIHLSEQKQQEIRQMEKGLDKYNAKLNSGTQLYIECDEVYKVREKVGVGSWGMKLFYDSATCCVVCEENCHYPCTVAWYADKCKIIKNGHCTVCTKKCPASDHVKEDWQYVTKTRKVRRTLKEMKKKYEVKKEGISDMLAALKQENDRLEKEKNEFLEEAYKHVMKLDEIALSVNSLSTFVHLDFLIEKMKEKREDRKAYQLEKIKNSQDKGVASVMKVFYKKETKLN
ncbi:PREDICTED: uncharacterized protein LOC107091529 [Cyprinodon variegatus]|uniref:uncharacterized protein LOC107091529 n=1 Tax=Cyprinodon variegatus TaxID=28743 RepID=UPI00074264B1|nr:PREDICTED: uncharacterized protein LOC107091529 [Cyprinodon variegatus]